MAKVELAELGKLTPYRFYKTETISPILTMVLSNIESGKEYGLCVVCGGDIPIKRLELVPAALACVGCDEKR
ncbi:TraR/DksA C4-type zinc finger protein [Candidatus Nomurabacteria bacterium]|nr:TraR/DksA C4-type zinc finger protein [Candidatus Nomurabacteria bacterium]